MLTDNVIALSFLMTDARTSQTGLQQTGDDDLNACTVNYGGCPYLCLPVNHTHRRCACPDDLNESCTEYG